MTFRWLDKTEYPFTSYHFNVNGHQLHYIDEGYGETILFIHGTPSWSFDFRNVIQRLSQTYRCVAIDHIGFGLSDKPEHYDYSTIHHSRTLEKFILDKKLQDFTMVVHDFGGPIGLYAAMQHPEKVKNLVVLNSWLWSSQDDPDYIRLKKILNNPLLPFLYRYLNFSSRFILPKSFGNKKIPKRILKQYTRPFADKTQRNGTLAFAKSLLNDQEWFEDLWNKKEVIQAKPTLFIWGMKDPIIHSGYLDKFISGFPNAMVKELAYCGHFPQEENPEEVSAFILHFLKNVNLSS